jgi:hypothetical protein
MQRPGRLGTLLAGTLLALLLLQACFFAAYTRSASASDSDSDSASAHQHHEGVAGVAALRGRGRGADRIAREEWPEEHEELSAGALRVEGGVSLGLVVRAHAG